MTPPKKKTKKGKGTGAGTGVPTTPPKPSWVDDMQKAAADMQAAAAEMAEAAKQQAEAAKQQAETAAREAKDRIPTAEDLGRKSIRAITLARDPLVGTGAGTFIGVGGTKLAQAVAKKLAKPIFAATAVVPIVDEFKKQFQDSILSLQQVSISGTPLGDDLEKLPRNMNAVVKSFKELTGADARPSELQISTDDIKNNLVEINKFTGDFKALLNTLPEDSDKIKQSIAASMAIVQQFNPALFQGAEGEQLLNDLVRLESTAEGVQKNFRKLIFSADELSNELGIPMTKALEMVASRFKSLQGFGTKALDETLKLSKLQLRTGLESAELLKDPLITFEKAGKLQENLGSLVKGFQFDIQKFSSQTTSERVLDLAEQVRQASKEGRIALTGEIPKPGDPMYNQMVALFQQASPELFKDKRAVQRFFKTVSLSDDEFMKISKDLKAKIPDQAADDVLARLAEVRKERTERAAGTTGEGQAGGRFNMANEFFKRLVAEQVSLAAGEDIAKLPGDINKKIIDGIRKSPLGRILESIAEGGKEGAAAIVQLKELSTFFKAQDQIAIEGIPQMSLLGGLSQEDIKKLGEQIFQGGDFQKVVDEIKALGDKLAIERGELPEIDPRPREDEGSLVRAIEEGTARGAARGIREGLATIP